jgi:hypothetical protein
VSKSNKNLPGPSSYEVKIGFVPKKVTIFLPASRKTSLTPGVCDYNVKQVEKHKPEVKMATSKRKPTYLIKDDAFTTPGPANYQPLRSQFTSQPLAKLTGKGSSFKEFQERNAKYFKPVL